MRLDNTQGWMTKQTVEDAVAKRDSDMREVKIEGLLAGRRPCRYGALKTVANGKRQAIGRKAYHLLEGTSNWQ